MASKNIDVNSDSIAAAARSSIAKLQDDLDANMDAMHVAVAALDATWEGPNHDDFVTDFQARWTVLSSFNKMLKTYLAAISTAALDYETAESDALQYIK